ncbi:MAG TPA: hypothetical protein VK775_07305 [Chthoniobacterales bacterium]|jgi:hypothetical protein|nr:hypothetical protein [Chthoniobacterales bacterium]
MEKHRQLPNETVKKIRQMASGPGKKAIKHSAVTHRSLSWKRKIKLTKASFPLGHPNPTKAPIVREINIRLSKTMRDTLSTNVPSELAVLLGLEPNATFATAICKCAVLEAAAGDVQAMRFVYEVAEQRKLSGNVNIFNITPDRVHQAIEAARQNPFQLEGAIDV